MSIAITRQRIATGEADKRTVRKVLREEFERARAAYLAASDGLVVEIAKIGDYKVTVDHHESNQKGVEAGWVAAGELEVCKNDRERAAQMEMLRGTDPQYLSLGAAAANTRALLHAAEVAQERLKMDIRICRMDIEMCIAELHALSGEEIERHA